MLLGQNLRTLHRLNRCIDLPLDLELFIRAVYYLLVVVLLNLIDHQSSLDEWEFALPGPNPF